MRHQAEVDHCADILLIASAEALQLAGHHVDDPTPRRAGWSFVAGSSDGKPVFRALPRISDTGVADLLQVIRARLLRYLVRRRVVEDDGEGQTRFLADDLAEREQALAQLAAAAVSGLPPAGPELRRKPLTVVLPASDGPEVVRPSCVDEGGFSFLGAGA
jgi:hypothetical protein